MMILQSDEVAVEPVEEAVKQAAKRKVLPGASRIRLERLREGLTAQIMHVGPFSDEKPTIDRLHEFIRIQRLRTNRQTPRDLPG